MKKNAVVPYGIIAVLGIFLVIIISIVGLNQPDAIQQAEDNGGEQQTEEGATADDPETIFKNNCSSCHGADLSGNVGPNLQKVGSKYSEDEIKEIIANGFPESGMSPGIVKGEQAAAIAKWLSEKK